jgi:hypothetical protein
MMAFKLATKESTFLRLALCGPSGSGKTFTSLSIAKGIGGKIAVIDTEYGSSRKLSDRFTFDCEQLDNDRSVQRMTQGIHDAEKGGYSVLIIDSLTHAWTDLVRQANDIGKRSSSGNTFAAWSQCTPMQEEFIKTILGAKLHIICTMRVKTEWACEKNDQGKIVPVRKGLAPKQGKDIEYEFDMLMLLDTDHNGTIEKDRTGKYQDQFIELPGEQLGKELAAWLQDGEAPKEEEKMVDDTEALMGAREEISILVDEHKITEETQAAWVKHFKVENLGQLSLGDIEAIIKGVMKKYKETE